MPLKPCPFCDANAGWLVSGEMSDEHGDCGRVIHCGRCGAYGPRFVPSMRTFKPTDEPITTKADAMRGWNERGLP